VFPNAEIVVSAAEYKFRTDPAVIEKLPEARRPLAQRIQAVVSKKAPDLTAVRAKVKAKDFKSALVDLNIMIDKGVQHADVYNLLGFSLRKTGDYPKALTFYKKALDFDANHKGAHEYLGELYVETGQMPKAREHLAILCPQGCEEREDLAKAVSAAAAKAN
jgi:tetratricopeptide (TPR) repeat protein